MRRGVRSIVGFCFRVESAALCSWSAALPPPKRGRAGDGVRSSCAWEFEIEEPKPGCRNTTESPNESPPGGLPLVYDPIFLDGDVSNARPL